MQLSMLPTTTPAPSRTCQTVVWDRRRLGHRCRRRVGLWPLQQRLIYFPNRSPLPTAAAVLAGGHDVALETSDGLRLGAWPVRPGRDVAVLVAPATLVVGSTGPTLLPGPTLRHHAPASSIDVDPGEQRSQARIPLLAWS